MTKITISLLFCLIIPLAASAATRSLVVEWGYDPPIPSDLAGFNLYMEGTKVATITDPVGRTYTGEIEARDEKTCYTMTAVDKGGGESPHSPAISPNRSPSGEWGSRIPDIVWAGTAVSSIVSTRSFLPARSSSTF